MSGNLESKLCIILVESVITLRALGSEASLVGSLMVRTGTSALGFNFRNHLENCSPLDRSTLNEEKSIPLSYRYTKTFSELYEPLL